MPSHLETVSAFVEGAPPGEVRPSGSNLRNDDADVSQARRCPCRYAQHSIETRLAGVADEIATRYQGPDHLESEHRLWPWAGV